MVATVDTQCHSLGSTQGSDRPTQPTIKEGSVANSDTFGECHSLGFTRGSDGVTHATLQDGPEMIVDTTPGERTHLTHHEGSIVASPCLMSNKIQDGTLRGNYCHGTSNDNIERDTALSIEVLPSTKVDN